MISNNNIICFGFAEWDNPYRTNQHHMMEMLSRDNTVLFIESLGLRRPTLQKKDVTRIFRRLFKWFRGVRNPQPGLYVFAPLVIPFHKYSVVRRFNEWFLTVQLDLVVKHLHLERPVIWTYIPNAVQYFGRWKERLSVYHCVDELSANPLIPKDMIIKAEQELLRRVDVVFTTAQSLYESKKPYNPSTYYLPNVADFDHFNKDLDAATVIPQDIEAVPRPRIGFVGAISEYKLDFELIARCADRHPGWSFVFVGAKGEGEKAADIDVLSMKKNVSFPGGRPYDSLPGILKGFDVCILPNRLNEYTRNMFPMKFFEYLSAGKPVVTTALEALKEFKEYCYYADSAEEFEKGIQQALMEQGEEKKLARLAVARRYTWESRLDQMARIIEPLLNRENAR